MRRLLLACLAAAALAVPAHAADGPTGSPCSFQAVQDPRPSVDQLQHVGVMWGGPYAAGGTLVCTLQVESTTHDGPDTVARTASNADVVVLAPTRVEYDDGAFGPYLCTQFTPDGGDTLYWTGEGPGGHWTTDASAQCQGPRQIRIPPDCESCLSWLLDEVFRGTVDPAVCPALVAQHPAFADPAAPVYVAPDGDTYVAGQLEWDCPPYLAG